MNWARTGGILVTFVNRKAAMARSSWLSRWVCGFGALIALMLCLAPFTPRAAAQSIALIELSMDAAGIGYDGYYRAGQWLPLQVRISNHSETAIRASLVIRPQTSPESVANTFSAPVYLSPDAGSRINVTLYIQPLARARLLRLEPLALECELRRDHSEAEIRAPWSRIGSPTSATL